MSEEALDGGGGRRKGFIVDEVEVFEFVMTPGVTKNFGGSGTFWKDTIYLFVLSGTQRGT